MKKIIFLFITISNNLSAQQPLQLSTAINIALKNSLNIQLAKNTVQSNTILNNYGVAGGLPAINGSATDNEQVTTINQKLSTGTDINRSGASGNSLSAGVNAGILLYNGMHVVATKNRLAELENQSEKLLNSQIQNTIASVMTGYYDVIRQQSYLKTLNLSIAVSQQKLDIIKVQQSVGLANNADLFQAEVDLNTTLQTSQSQQLIIDQSKTELLRLMNVKIDSTINIEDTILVDSTIRYDDINLGLQNNADILAAADQIKINELIVKETAALRYPSIRVSTGYNYARSQTQAGFTLLNQSYGPFLGLSLAIPIYNGSAYKRQQKVAEINIQSAELQRQNLIKDYTADAVKMYEAYQNNLQQLQTAKQNYLLSQQLLALVLQRFQLRVATIVDLKIAQQSFENAGFVLINLSFAAKSAEIELKRLANSLSF
ncbi:MAG: TolC family protein [Chitinophagaceae bacterium]